MIQKPKLKAIEFTEIHEQSCSGFVVDAPLATDHGGATLVNDGGEIEGQVGVNGENFGDVGIDLAD